MAGIVEAAVGGDILARAIVDEIERRIEDAIQAEVADVTEKVTKRIRSELAQIAAAVISDYDMSRQGNILHIRVQVGPDNTKEPG